MKERTSKVGGLLEAKGVPKDKEYKELFPETFGEIPEYCHAQGIDEGTFLQYAWRGRTLSFQGGGETLTEEEKQERKVARKADNSEISELRKLAKEQGMSLAQLIKTLKP